MTSLTRNFFSLSIGLALGAANQTACALTLQALRPLVGAELILNGVTNVITPEVSDLQGIFPIGEQPPAVIGESDAAGIRFTGVGTDLAIRGSGWFAVRVPDQNEVFYTRTGDFRLDWEGYLVTSQGHRVQGFNTPNVSEVGDIQIDDRFRPTTAAPTASMVTFQIERDGRVVVSMSDGTKYVRAQILLQDFAAPDKLERLEYHLFASTSAAIPASALVVPNSNGVGSIESSALDVTPLSPQLAPLALTDEHAPFLLGAITRTSNPTDLTVRGAGAFIVRDPVTSELFATRAGMFLVDSNNYLITYDRKRLQGKLDKAANTLGDIQLDAPTAPTDPNAAMTTYRIGRDGRITVQFTDGTSSSSARIFLYDFDQPEKLRPVGLGQFAGVNAAQPFPLPNVGRFGGSNSWIQSGALELVNVTPDLLARRRYLSFFTQGALYRASNLTDLAIDGAGFFLVQDPGNGRQYATRDGRFEVAADGFLVTARGLRLQGYPTGTATEVGDLRINPDSLLPDVLVFFSISSDGSINAHFSDGTESRIGQVLLLDFKEPFLLREFRDGLYRNLAAAQPRTLAEPGTFGLGNVVSSALESPVDLEQFTLPPRDGFRFMITGEPGSRWIVQATDDFRHWRQIGIVENAGFESEFCDRGSRQHRARAYCVQAEFALPQFNSPTPTFSNILTNSGPTCPPPRRPHRR